MARVFFWPPAEDAELPAAYLGVTVQILPDGSLHVGLLYRTAQYQPQVLHLLGHYGKRLMHDFPNSSQVCVLSPIDVFEVPAAARFFREIYRKNNNRGLAYGLTPPTGEWFDAAARFIEGQSGRGLCCQTFVLAAFAAVGWPLIEPEEAPARSDDEARQQALFDRITERINEATSRTQEHFAQVHEQIGTPLYRPLEVAGAARAEILPCSFPEALAFAEEIQALLKDKVPAS